MSERRQDTPQSIPQPHHRLTLKAQAGALDLELKLALRADWTILFGPSGSGKTTILRSIAGLFAGAHACLTSCPVDGVEEDLSLLSPNERRIAYAPQQPSLFPHLTVASNVFFAQQTNNASTASRQHLNKILTLFRLEEMSSRFPRQLSGGEQQRVNLARAFAVAKPRLMLLDEPFTGIDRPLRDAILPELRAALRDRGIPVLSVTHDVEEAFRLQAEVVTLRNGRIQDQGNASDVLRAERLSLLDALR